MTNINFTIAVMIYNVEQFLPACIESCIKQSGDDIEILLIDDGSTDRSGNICDEYAERDSRVSVIHKQNGGVSTARNTALKNAKGKWLIQVDGDDLLTENAVELVRHYAGDDYEILQFDAIPFFDIEELKQWKPKGNEMILQGDDLKDYHVQLIERSDAKVIIPIYNINPAWSKAWNMDFIRANGLQYDETVHKGEGTLFTFTASYYVKHIRVVPQPLYGYRKNPASIMNRFNSNILESQTIQWQQYYKVILEHGEELNPEIMAALNRRALYLIGNAVNLGVAHPDCPWDNEKCIDWCKTLCTLDWVQQAVKYAKDNDISNSIFDFIRNNDYIKLAKKCASLKNREKFKKSKIGRIITNLYGRIK